MRKQLWTVAARSSPLSLRRAVLFAGGWLTCSSLATAHANGLALYTRNPDHLDGFGGLIDVVAL